jgi:DNA-binding MarR family transcriptional regulator
MKIEAVNKVSLTSLKGCIYNYLRVREMDSSEHQQHIRTIAKECIAVRVRVLNRVVTSLFDDALRPLGLRVSQMNILVAAALIEPAQPARLCKVLHLDPSTLSRNVERMKQRGLVETVPGEDDRTHRIVVLPEGFRVLEEAYPLWMEAQARVADLLGAQEVKDICRMGSKLMSGE